METRPVHRKRGAIKRGSGSADDEELRQGQNVDVRREIERGLACYGRGAVLEALEAWRKALHDAPRNEEALRLVELVERRLATPAPDRPALLRRTPTAPGATPQRLLENDLTPVSPLSAWLAPSTHPTELELLVATEEAAPVKVTYEVSTRPVMSATPSLVRRPQSSAAERAQFQIEQCQRLLVQDDVAGAAAAAELALQAAEAEDDAQAWALLGPRLSLIERAFALLLGPKTGVPFLVRGLSAIQATQVDHRIGYLASCIDGHTDMGALLDICGMPRLEALRALAQLLNGGFLRLR